MLARELGIVPEEKKREGGNCNEKEMRWKGGTGDEGGGGEINRIDFIFI